MRIALGDIEVEVDCAGDSGPAVLLVHGLGGSRRTWDCLVPLLTARARVFVPDLRGCGASTRGLLPYTLAQDFTLFVLLREKSIDIWKRKAAWVVHRGGMLLLNTHPDYMSFDEKGRLRDEYDVLLYEKFLLHIRDTYKDAYWHALPREVAHWWNSRPAAR